MNNQKLFTWIFLFFFSSQIASEYETATIIKEIIHKPKLYALVIGVSDYNDKGLKLMYPAKDAIDFSNALKRQEGGLYELYNVKLLQNPEKEDLQKGLDWLSSEVTDKDMAVLFLSGHGQGEEDGNYYFLTKESNSRNLRDTAVSYLSIKKTISELPCKVLVFVNTDQEVSDYTIDSVGTSTDATFKTSDIKYTKSNALSNIHIEKAIKRFDAAENGVIVFASSAGGQFSTENPKLGNGAFSKALIEGLDGAANYTIDGVITVNQLDLYISERVKRLTENKQTPVTTKPQGVIDFPVALKIIESRQAQDHVQSQKSDEITNNNPSDLYSSNTSQEGSIFSLVKKCFVECAGQYYRSLAESDNRKKLYPEKFSDLLKEFKFAEREFIGLLSTLPQEYMKFGVIEPGENPNLLMYGYNTYVFSNFNEDIYIYTSVGLPAGLPPRRPAGSIDVAVSGKTQKMALLLNGGQKLDKYYFAGPSELVKYVFAYRIFSDAETEKAYKLSRTTPSESLIFPIPSSRLDYTEKRLEYLKGLYHDGIILGAKNPYDAAEEGKVKWYTFSQGSKECIQTMSPADKIQSLRETGQKANVKDTNDPQGNLLMVEVSYYDAFYHISYTFYKNKKICLDALHAAKEIPDKYK